MLRIHVTPADLGRVQLVSDLDPVWEVFASARLLVATHVPPHARRWRDHCRGLLTRAEQRMAAETVLRHAPEGAPVTSYPDVAGIRAAFAIWYELAVLPHHDVISAAVMDDRVHRGDLLCHNGVDGLLRDLGDLENGVLRIPCPGQGEFHLEGRGLRLVASYFTTGACLAIAQDATPVLVHPLRRAGRQVDGPRHRIDRTTGDGAALSALVGATRAMVLRMVGDGHTTSELAQRARISPATASHHATVLRQAGLVVTHREANRMVHRLTPLGLSLLGQRGRPDRR